MKQVTEDEFERLVLHKMLRSHAMRVALKRCMVHGDNPSVVCASLKVSRSGLYAAYNSLLAEQASTRATLAVTVPKHRAAAMKAMTAEILNAWEHGDNPVVVVHPGPPPVAHVNPPMPVSGNPAPVPQTDGVKDAFDNWE